MSLQKKENLFNVARTLSRGQLEEEGLYTMSPQGKKGKTLGKSLVAGGSSKKGNVNTELKKEKKKKNPPAKRRR